MWTWGQFNYRNIRITRRISGIWQIGPWKLDALTVFSWLNAPGVYFKLGAMDPAFIWSRRLFGARRLLTRCFSCHFINLIYDYPTFKNQQSWSRRDAFSLHSVWQTFSLVTRHSIQHAFYCILQSWCVKKGINNKCSILRQGNKKFKFISDHNNINLLARPQINAGTPIKHRRRLIKK